jgi:hypothetical protein
MTREEAKTKLEWVHTDRETVYMNIDKIFDKQEEQLKTKDERIKELEDEIAQYDYDYDALLSEVRELKAKLTRKPKSKQIKDEFRHLLKDNA